MAMGPEAELKGERRLFKKLQKQYEEQDSETGVALLGNNTNQRQGRDSVVVNRSELLEQVPCSLSIGY
ncbi:hypothetical protein EB796_016529 [Bugula neritina]|uniref:Uncharacterized protein n=1 Tax=Bugula neritina TaxID=10212 RepID=A0A7J7JFR5_BUGNE|nr:hypothetical protein EB796_016529 [Bugula neritina]